MKKIIGYYFLLLSSIIGAGLITGQEIISFFGGFNLKTVFAIILSSVIICFLVYKGLGASQSKIYQKIKNNKFYQVFVCISCVVVAGAMVAGVNEFTIRTNLPQIIGIAVLIISSIFAGKLSTFFKKFSRIICVLILISFICVVMLSFNVAGNVTQVRGTQTLVKCFCYASFNIFLLLPLAEESGQNLSKKQRIGLAIFLSSSLCVYLLLGCYAISFVGGSLPLISLASKLGWFYYVYLVMAVLAILTTLFSCLYSIKQVSDKKLWLYILIIGLIFVVSLFGFESIIEYFYLVIGVIGSFVLFFS